MQQSEMAGMPANMGLPNGLRTYLQETELAQNSLFVGGRSVASDVYLSDGSAGETSVRIGSNRRAVVIQRDRRIKPQGSGQS